MQYINVLCSIKNIINFLQICTRSQHGTWFSPNCGKLTSARRRLHPCKLGGYRKDIMANQIRTSAAFLAVKRGK